jgi:hypothetical protein
MAPSLLSPLDHLAESGATVQGERMNVPTSSLEDPDYAAFAWARYRVLMWWMVLASLLAVVAGLGILWLLAGPIPWLMMLWTSLGIFFAVLLAAALMGLVFLSSGSGHDHAILDPFDEQDQGS